MDLNKAGEGESSICGRAAAGGSVSHVKASRQKKNAGEVEEDALF